MKNNNLYKKLKALLSITLVLSFFSAISANAMMVSEYDDFEGDFDGWQAGAVANETYKANITLSNGNLIMSGNATNTTNGYAPNVYRLINGEDGIPVEVGKNVVIKTKFKVKESDTRTYIKLNRPLEVKELSTNTTGWNLYQLLVYNQGTVSVASGNGGTGSVQANKVDVCKNLIAGTWIDVKIVLKPNEAGTVYEKADYYVTVNGTTYTQMDRVIPTAGRTDGWSDLTSVRSVAFTARENTNTTTIDYFNVYEYYAQATAKMYYEKGEYYTLGDNIAVQFNTDVENANEKNVILKNEEGTPIDYIGTYNESLKRYYIVPEENLSEGKYTLEFKSGINVSNSETENCIPSELKFEYWEGEPKFPPYADDVFISGNAYTGAGIMGQYSFFDINDDLEDKDNTIYRWYISDTKTGEYLPVEGENTQRYIISGDDLGKYIKFSVTVSSCEEPYYGEEVFSEAIGPVADREYNKNYIVNGDFETGEISPWGISANNNDNLEIAIVQDEVFEGDYALSVNGRKQNSSMWGQSISLENNKTYIFDGYVKAAPNASMNDFECEAYWNGASGGTIDRIYRDKEKTIASKDKWNHFTQTVEISGTNGKKTVTSPAVVCWPGGQSGYDFYVDNLYVGVLEIGDIETNIPESIVIPSSGEIEYEITGKVLNQKGTEAGLYNEKFEIACGNYSGIYIDDNILHVTDRAVTGTYVIYLSCEPTFMGATESDNFLKKVNLKLVSNGSKKPLVSNVNLKGTVEEGAQINLNYDYYQVDGEKDASVIEWYFSDKENGVYKKIEGASDKKYTVASEYKNSYIKAKIVPTTEKGNSNSEIWSNVTAVKTAPQVTKITVEGGGFVGARLTGSYGYYDINQNPEAESKFRWLRSETEDGEYRPIDGADKMEYILTERDIDMYIKFEVVPVTVEEPYEGEAYTSEAIKGPVPPVVSDVKIKRTGKYLVGVYTYEHIHGVEEGESQLKWYVNGKFAGNGAEFNAKDGDKITFEVTPVASKAPYNGEALTANISIPKSSSGGGGSSGGGKINVSSNTITNGLNTVINSIIDTTKTNDEYDKIQDVSGHWSEKYVQRVVSENIMEIDSDNMFYPETKALRKDVVRWIAKAIGVSKKYENEFADVLATEDYADGLQALVDIGVISKDERFYPEREISRQEIAKIITKVFEYKAVNKEIIVDVKVLFKDYDDISDWAREYVESTVSYGLMVGVGDNRFMPKNNTTKAQIATLICNMLDRIEVAENKQ